jgi:pentatricopeptide repeat protein
MNDTDIPEIAGTESLVAEVVDEFMGRLRRGEHPEVEDYARRHPRIAALLRHVLPALEVIGTSAPGRSAGRAAGLAEIEPEGSLGDYRIVRELGRGGMGIVYQAVQISLGREVALKVLPFAAALDLRQLQRFKNEAQAAAHLHHTNIVPVYGVGCERGVHYYAMQYIEGQTMAAVIAELRRLAGLDPEDRDEPVGAAAELTRELASGRWAPAGRHAGAGGMAAMAAGPESGSPPGPGGPSVVTAQRSATLLPTDHSTRKPPYFRTIAHLGIQAARALEHAHSMGVIHRDIKPANLIVDSRGNLWITDFGLARLQGGIELTVTGDLVGTLRYMSPEQALGHRVIADHRTDVYSLGMTLYELVTLEPAFGGRDRSELLRQIAFAEPRRPRLLNEAVPSDLETIILKAIEKGPAERYATAEDLANDLQRFLDDRPIRARRPTITDRVRKLARRHRSVVITGALGVLAVALIAAGGIGWIMSDRAARWAITEREVNRALGEAADLQEQSKWPEALEAIKRAEGLLAGDVDEALHRRVLGRRKDLEMVLRLEEIWLPRPLHGREGSYDYEWADASYAEAFREYGIDVEALEPTEAAARIRARTIRLVLATALDVWADRRTRSRQANDESWKRLLAVARAADPDAWRNRMRDAMQHRDRRALKELAASALVAELPVQTLSLLVQLADETEQSRSLLRQAQREHPHNFHLTFQLAWGAPLEEAIRFYTAALSIRPRNAPTAFFLGNALRARGRLDEAIALYRKATLLDPGFARAYCALINTLLRQGKPDEANAVFRKALESRPHDPAEVNGLAWFLAIHPHPEFRAPGRAVELGELAVGMAPHNGDYWNTLGVARYRAGDCRGAIEALEKSVSFQGHNSYDDFFLAMCRWRLDARQDALRLYEQAVQWMQEKKPNDEELRRFRAEAVEHLGIGDPSLPGRESTVRQERPS